MICIPTKSVLRQTTNIKSQTKQVFYFNKPQTLKVVAIGWGSSFTGGAITKYFKSIKNYTCVKTFCNNGCALYQLHQNKTVDKK